MTIVLAFWVFYHVFNKVTIISNFPESLMNRSFLIFGMSCRMKWIGPKVHIGCWQARRKMGLRLQSVFVLISEQIGRKYWARWSYYASFCNILYSREDFWRVAYVDMKHYASLCNILYSREDFWRDCSRIYWYETQCEFVQNFVQSGRFLKRLQSHILLWNTIWVCAKLCARGSGCRFFRRFQFHIIDVDIDIPPLLVWGEAIPPILFSWEVGADFWEDWSRNILLILTLVLTIDIYQGV